jgi:hypothetical protein
VVLQLHYPKTILVSGHAKYPQDAAARSVYERFTVTVLVDTESWTPIEIEVTLITKTAREFISEKLRNYSLLNSPEDIITDIENSYFGGAKKTIIAAIRNLFHNISEVYQILQSSKLENKVIQKEVMKIIKSKK